MIPQIDNQLEYESEDIEKIKLPSKTYKLNKNINTVIDTVGGREVIEVDKIAGFVDDIEAIKQAAYHILNVERYSCIIYDDDYGVELEQYIGQNLEYIEATIQDTLTEALTQDERIIAVEVTNIEKTNIDCVHIEFVLICDTGEIEMEVDINV